MFTHVDLFENEDGDQLWGLEGARRPAYIPVHATYPLESKDLIF